MKQLFTLFSFLFFLSITSYSQLNYNVSLGGGQSDFIRSKNNLDKWTSIRGTKYRGMTYSLGGGVDYRFNESRFAINSGLEFNYFSMKHDFSITDISYIDGVLDTTYRNDQTKLYNRNTLNIPIVGKYYYEEWIIVYAGLSFSYDLFNNVYSGYDKDRCDDPYYVELIGGDCSILGFTHKKFNYAFTAGIDFIIKKKILLGVNYYEEIDESSKLYPNEIFKWRKGTIKLGYIIK